MMRRYFVTVLTGVLLAAISCGVSAADKKLHSAINPVPRKGGWMKRHEAMNARVKKGNVDLVFIGDSITQGWEGGGRKVWQKYYGKRNAVNLGIGGDRTQHVIWRLENGNLEGISPKLAVIMIGTNNAGSNTPREIAEGTAAIVKLVRQKCPKTKILLLATFPRGKDSNDKRRIVNQASNALTAKLADGKHVFFLDINKKFLEEDGTLTRRIMPDLLHPGQEGYRIWAAAIEPEVKKLMAEK
jgi:lysophospholipase L1-like esterase